MSGMDGAPAARYLYGMDSADRIIADLRLSPHPEGGWYRQTWVSDVLVDGRPTGTCIYFLLKAGERSHWHRVDAAEHWFWHAGAPLTLSLAATDAGPATDHMLGSDVLAGEAPQILVPTGNWQAAASRGGWTLASCTVSPGFRFEGFTLAPPGFDIPR